MYFWKVLNEGFKSKIRNRKISKTIEKNKREIKFPVLSEIRTCGVLVKSDTYSDKLFEKLNEKVVVEKLFFSDKNRDKGDDSNVIFLSDMNFWDLPPKSLINEFVEKPFDILINLAFEKNDAIDYVVASSNSKFKVNTLL
ncbi:MAG: hypothetical protein PF541_10675, partial [Prolixibacteraceae bacterium]|nr:hypothetical protein [Prolixibacteraceae bacterium]